MEDYSTKPKTLKEPLYVESGDDIDSLSSKLSDNIESIVEAVQILEDYSQQFGTENDTRGMRKKMKEHISSTTVLIKKTGELLKQFESFKPKKKEDIDLRNKLLKRTKDNYTKQNDRFNKITKDIQSKEKIYLEARKSLEKKSGSTSTATSDLENNIQIQSHDLDYTEALMKERETNIQDVRSLARELNLTAQLQAQKLQEASEDIEILQEQVDQTEKHTEMANKQLDETLKNRKPVSLKCFFRLFALIAIVVIILILLKKFLFFGL